MGAIFEYVNVLNQVSSKATASNLKTIYACKHYARHKAQGQCVDLGL